MKPKQVREQKRKEKIKKVNQKTSNFSTFKAILHCKNLNLSSSTSGFFERKLALAGMNKRSTETTDSEESKKEIVTWSEAGHVKM